MTRLLPAIALAALGFLGLSPAALAAGDPRHGETLYRVYCTQCHGQEGNGRGVNAPAMSVLPRDHTDRGEMSARTDEDLFKAIHSGGKAVNKSILMPNWDGNLNDAEINDLVAYLRELCCKNPQ